MPVDLQGKPIVISGASSGIGAATALACARAGMPVALMARRMGRLDLVAARVRELGGQAVTLAGSVDSPEDCAAVLKLAHAELGPVYAAFANAGYGEESPTWSMPLHKIRDMFETNFYGSLNLIQPALEMFVASAQGHAIWCSSCVSKLGIPNYGCYSATKAAQDHFGRAMRIELAPKGVAVSTVHPIGTQTEFFDTAAARSDNARMLPKDRKLQPASRVADAIVRQLRAGRGKEIWTSTPARLMFGVACTFPGLADRGLRRRMIKRMSGEA